MSVKIMGAVWDSALPHNLKFVLLSYADHANHEGGDIWPAVATTARKTGYTERAVQKIARQLMDAGILVDDGIYSNNVRRWQINLAALAAYGRGEQNSPPPEQDSPPDAPRGELDDTQGVNSTPPRGEQNSPKPTTDPSTTDPSIGGGGDPDLIPQDHPASEKNTRAPARATPPAPSFPAGPGAPPTYDAANRNPAAIDHALQHAEILDLATRVGILRANPDLTVEQILAWDAYRTRANATNGRRLGPGALVSLLRTAAKPPRSTTDPETTARWLTTHGYLPPPEPSDWSDQPDPPIPADQPSTDPDTLQLWQRIIAQIHLTNPGFVAKLKTAKPLTYTSIALTIAAPPDLADYITRPGIHANLTTIASALAGHPLAIHITQAAAP